MARKLTDDDIKLVFKHEMSQAIGYLGSDLSEQRVDAMDRYLGKPYGNEVDGRSKVVSTDVADTIEWILPSLLRIFTSGDEAGRYEPRKPEDTESAQQATEYANWVWNSQNEGFKNYYVWLKDGLIQKSGVVKIWWDSNETYEREEYENLPDAAFAEIVSDDNVEVVEHSEEPNLDPVVDSAAIHSVVIKRKKTSGKIKVDPVPPEEFLISREGKHIQTARAVFHRCRRTVSDLREDGYEESLLEQIGGEGSATWNDEQIARSTLDDETSAPDLRDPAIDDSMREVWVEEGYIRADRNGDGIAEMLQITMAGNVILSIEEWKGPRPFAAWSPIMMPHRFYGLSIADIIKDLQLIKTTILRQYLDGLYLANNARTEVKEDMIVNPDEVMDSRPGGIIRTRGTTQAIFPLQTAFVGEAALTGLNYIDQLRENRTGVSPRVQGLGSNVLHDTASGEHLMLSKAMEKIELIARVFAETGVRDAFQLILALLGQYQDQPTVIKLRGKWVPMDPRAWKNEYDFSVNVGLGNGSRDTMAGHLQGMLAIQMQAVQMQGGIAGPLVTGENIYNTLSRYIESIGLKTVDPYFTDPSTVPPQPPKPDPKAQEAQAKLQLDAAKAQQDAQLQREKLDIETAHKQQQAQIDIQLAREKMMAEIELEREKSATQMQIARERMMAELDLAREKAVLEANVAVEVGKMNAESKVRMGGQIG